VIGFSRSVRVWALPKPADLRKGYNGLYGLVQQVLKRDPLGGDLFLFVNRKRTSCKVLLWDGTGLCIFSKRLEKGRFAKLWRETGDAEVTLTASELQLFIEGCELLARRRLSPEEILPKPLAQRRSA
jgi:transposase